VRVEYTEYCSGGLFTTYHLLLWSGLQAVSILSTLIEDHPSHSHSHNLVTSVREDWMVVLHSANVETDGHVGSEYDSARIDRCTANASVVRATSKAEKKISTT